MTKIKALKTFFKKFFGVEVEGNTVSQVLYEILENPDIDFDIGGIESHICSADEYDATTFIPTIADPKEDTFYLVPSKSPTSDDLYTEYIYVDGHWEVFGSKGEKSAGAISRTTAEWEADPTYLSDAGIVYIYSDYSQDSEGHGLPGYKIGDGVSYVVDLPFLSTAIATEEERESWNNKVTVEYPDFSSETLIFTTH